MKKRTEFTVTFTVTAVMDTKNYDEEQYVEAIQTAASDLLNQAYDWLDDGAVVIGEVVVTTPLKSYQKLPAATGNKPATPKGRRS